MANQNKNQRQKEITEHRTHRICVRFSEQEYRQLEEALAVSGLTISAFARKLILGERVASQADLAVLAELRRLGGLLKHVHNETRGAYSGLTAQAIKDLSAYVRILTEDRRTRKSDSPTGVTL